MIKTIPVYKVCFTDLESVEIALVDDPAIEVDFLKFNSEQTKLEFNEDKMIVKGAVMIPDKLIYRNDKLGERFVKFDVTEVEKAAMLFLKNGMKFNKSHSDIEASLDVLESYIATETNSLNVPVGSWIISAKVKDNALWQEIKSDVFNGFSLEGLFSNELIGTHNLEFNKNDKNDQMNLKEQLQAAINAVFFANETPAPVETPVETPAPEVKSEDNTVEEIKAMLEEFKTAILAEVDAKLVSLKEELAGSVSAIDAKVEEFGKQPLSKPVTETVTAPTESSYNYLSGVKLK